MLHHVALWPTILALGIACFTDIRSRRIPNGLVVPFACSGMAANCLLHGLAGLGSSIGGVCVAAAVCGLFCILRGMGMGDLKLCGAIGAWIGPHQLGFALLITFIAGAAIGIVWALCAGSLSRSLASTGDLLAGFVKTGIRPHHTITLECPGGLRIPYAPAIAVGTLFSFLAF